MQVVVEHQMIYSPERRKTTVTEQILQLTSFALSSYQW
jgi:hypothetical protein